MIVINVIISMGSRAWVENLVSPVKSYVTFGKDFNFPALQSVPLAKENDRKNLPCRGASRIFFVPQELKEAIYSMFFEQ